MKKIEFTHLEGKNKQRTNSIQIYLGNLNLDPGLDDMEVELLVSQGEVHFTILNPHYYYPNELSDLQAKLQQINWDNGYEFFELTDLKTGEAYWLVGDRNSTTFNQINSADNRKNLNNFLTAMNRK